MIISQYLSSTLFGNDYKLCMNIKEKQTWMKPKVTLENVRMHNKTNMQTLDWEIKVLEIFCDIKDSLLTKYTPLI